MNKNREDDVREDDVEMNARSNVAIASLDVTEGETEGSKDEKCGGEKGEKNDRKAERLY